MIGHKLILMHRYHPGHIIRVTATSISLHILIRIPACLQSLRFITLLLSNGNLSRTAGNGCRSCHRSQCRTNDGNTRHSLVCLHSGNSSRCSYLKNGSCKLLIGILFLNLIDRLFFLLLQLGSILTRFLCRFDFLVILAGNFAYLCIL